MGSAGGGSLVWEARHDMTTPLKQREYPVVKVVRYGRKLEVLPVVTNKDGSKSFVSR